MIPEDDDQVEPVGLVDTIVLLVAPVVLPIAIVLVVVYAVDWIRRVTT